MEFPACKTIIRMKSDGNGWGICWSLVTLCEGKAEHKNLIISLKTTEYNSAFLYSP